MSALTLKESASSRWQLPHTPYAWISEIGGVQLGDGSFVPLGAIVYEDDAYCGYGKLVRIVGASTTEDGRSTWVTVRRVDERTGRDGSRPSDERVLYSPHHLWRTRDLATLASKERAKGNHRIGAEAVS